MRALVTGANGLIGANLVRELLARGVQVRAGVRVHSRLAALAGLDVELVRADLSEDADADALAQALRDCELVFHTAVPFSYEPAQATAVAAAARGSERLLPAAQAAGVRRVVLTSSSVVFGYSHDGTALDENAPRAAASGENAYVSAKIAQDARALELARQFDLEILLACPTVCVGPHATTLGPSNGQLIAYLMDPWRTTYPGGCNVVATADVAAGHWLLAQHGRPGEHYLLGGENLSWRALHTMLAELAGVEPPRFELNHTSSYLAAAAERLRAALGARPALVTHAQAAMIGRYYYYDDGKARRLGYAPRPARAALAAALSWLAASPHVSRELRARLRLHEDVYAERRYGDARAQTP